MRNKLTCPLPYRPSDSLTTLPRSQVPLRVFQQMRIGGKSEMLSPDLITAVFRLDGLPEAVADACREHVSNVYDAVHAMEKGSDATEMVDKSRKSAESLHTILGVHPCFS